MRIKGCLVDEVAQYLKLVLSIFEGTGLSVQLQVITQVTAHKLKRIEDGYCYTVNKTVAINHDVHLIHVTKRRVCVGTTAMTERGGG